MSLTQASYAHSWSYVAHEILITWEAQANKDSFLVAFYRLCFDSSWRIVIASVLSDVYPWRYESNFSLQIFLPCSSYSALVTHILLRNVSVLDRETPPSHACVIGLEQRRFSRNDDSSGSGITPLNYTMAGVAEDLRVWGQPHIPKIL